MSEAGHMDGLEREDKLAIDALADEFEEALRAGQSPRIEDFAVRVREVARLAAMRELVQVEMELRHGPGPRADATVANQAASSNGAERSDGSDVRLANTRPHDSTTSGSGRLEVRCPNCHNPTEVAVDTTLTDLTCGS